MKSDPDKLLKKHQALVHSEHRLVTSHVQRADGEWFINTIMIEGCDVPFKYKRKQRYKSLQGQRVNLTYYADQMEVAGICMEYMKVIRLRIA
ncbi:MAG: hypothetical protein OEY07_02855 [Gammaproteobacteria bacterium]|nr:hypothetical protein [Gammaproteobacteria bacterium]